MLGIAAVCATCVSDLGDRAVTVGKELPDPDERFSQLILDYFAPQHLFIAEGEGARCIMDLLDSAPDVTGRKSLLYADTARHQSPGYVERLRTRRFEDFEVFANRLDLLRQLPSLLSQLSPPYRVYVAATGWFIQAVEALAGQAGISKDQILIEQCEASSRKVTCMLCQTKSVANSHEVFRCAGCGTVLQVSSYYCPQSHTHLAVPAHVPACSKADTQ